MNANSIIAWIVGLVYFAMFVYLIWNGLFMIFWGKRAKIALLFFCTTLVIIFSPDRISKSIFTAIHGIVQVTVFGGNGDLEIEKYTKNDDCGVRKTVKSDYVKVAGDILKYFLIALLVPIGKFIGKVAIESAEKDILNNDLKGHISSLRPSLWYNSCIFSLVFSAFCTLGIVSFVVIPLVLLAGGGNVSVTFFFEQGLIVFVVLFIFALPVIRDTIPGIMEKLNYVVKSS